MCPKDTSAPAWKTYTQIANVISDAAGDWRVDGQG